MDEQMQLRIFAPIDEVMRMLAASLQLAVPDPADPAAGHASAPPASALPPLDSGDVFELPYRADGQRELGAARGAATIKLDLRPGARLRLVGQPDWDLERCGDVATVVGRDPHGHYTLKLPRGGGRATRVLGDWWVKEALAGRLESIPVVPLSIVADARPGADGALSPSA